MLYTTVRKQTQITYIRHKSSYKQLDAKTSRNDEHRLYAEIRADITTRNSQRKDTIGQHKKLKGLVLKTLFLFKMKIQIQMFKPDICKIILVITCHNMA